MAQMLIFITLSGKAVYSDSATKKAQRIKAKPMKTMVPLEILELPTH